ncbi:MAG: hypothetical protein J7K33_11300 [Candidatus Marinimicrobia bacterium]|nr:hypothetical protein [Candidatus Neomarinimicrobiota bacterium]
MHKYLKVRSGLFIPREILKNAHINGENIEVELGEKEIRIRPVGKKPIEQSIPPFVPEKSMFFSIKPFKMGKIDHDRLDEIIYGK